MARVRKSTEFKIVNRVINGNKFQSTRPTSYIISKNPEDKKHKRKFGLAVHLASFLKKLDILYECWAEAKLDGSRPYNRIISYNYKRVTPEGPTESVMITPPGFKPPFKEISCTDGMINLTLSDAFKINPDQDYIAVIMILFDPRQKLKIPFQIIRIYYNRLTPDKHICFDLNLYHGITSYNKFILYSSVIRKAKKKLSWSSTHSFSYEL